MNTAAQRSWGKPGAGLHFFMDEKGDKCEEIIGMYAGVSVPGDIGVRKTGETNGGYSGRERIFGSFRP